MKRIEAKDLNPGDTFEYEYFSRYSRPQTQVKRDTVKPDMHGWWRMQECHSNVEGSKSKFGAFRLYTEIGSNNHGYVIFQDPKTVVVLLEDGDK